LSGKEKNYELPRKEKGRRKEDIPLAKGKGSIGKNNDGGWQFLEEN